MSTEQPFYKSLFPLKMNLQYFAEADPPADPPGEPNDPPSDPPADPPKDPEPEPKTYDEAYVKKLRTEAARHRTEKQQLKDQQDQNQQDMMKKVFAAFGLEPDPNKEFDKQLATAQQGAQEAETKANERLIRAEVKMKSAELGVIDDETAFVLMARDNVKINDYGSVEGVKESLETLIKNKPFLKGQAQQNIGSASNPGGGGGTQSDEEWGKEQAKKRSEKAQPAGGFNPWGN
jgi:type IV secretory pathway VirB10-like protein